MRQGRTVLFSSHILADVERVADRIAVIDKGRIRANCSLDEFRSAVKKVIVTFAESVPNEVDIEGLLHCRRNERQLELTLVGVEEAQIDEWAESVGAKDTHIPKINLEDQFIEFTAPSNRKKLFQWEEV